MTKVGIVSENHGDVTSLDSAHAHIRGMGCTMVLCLGDLLDIEPFGEELPAADGERVPSLVEW